MARVKERRRSSADSVIRAGFQASILLAAISIRLEKQKAEAFFDVQETLPAKWSPSQRRSSTIIKKLDPN